MINLYALPPLLAALLNGGLIAWVFSRARTGAVRLSFLLWNVCLAAWNLGVAVGLILPNAEKASAWYVLVGSFAVRFIAPTFLHFIATFTENDQVPRVRRAIIAAYLSGAVFTCLGLRSDLLMKQAVHYYWGYYPLAGRYEWTFGVSLYFISGYAFWLLWKTLKQSTGHRRNQMDYILAGATIVFGAGFTNFLPLYGISVYPIGNVMNSLYSLIVAYAIVEYGLMDIRIALKRGTVYAMLSGGLTMGYLSIVAVLQRLFGHYGIQENYVFYTAAFPLTVILAPTMKTRIEPWVDRTFFGSSLTGPESQSSSKEISFMGILATEMAHEITKPLTRIINEHTRLEGTLKGKSQESLKKIEKEARRAAEIIDGFVMLSPHMPLHRKPSALAELLEQSLAMLSIEEDDAIQIKRHFESIPDVPVNTGQVIQILTNILQNSWQAMPEGGILALSIQRSTSRSGEETVDVGIEDSGPGIPMELQKQVFEPFYTTKQAQGGRGVGLTICHAMVERHGGTIQIKSPIYTPSGTRILIQLPIHPKETLHETK